MSERSVSRRRHQKQWYTLMAPEQFDRAAIGETPADEPDQVLGRTIQTTLGEITGNANEHNVKLTFKVTDVGSDAAYTEFVRHELASDYLRSLVRRGSSKVAAVLTVRTKDDYRMRVQPVAFTTKRADHSQQRALRETMTEVVERNAREHTYREFADSIVRGRLSSAMYGEAKSIYPLRRVEVQKAVLDAHPEEVYEEEETAADVDEADVAVDVAADESGA